MLTGVELNFDRLLLSNLVNIQCLRDSKFSILASVRAVIKHKFLTELDDIFGSFSLIQRKLSTTNAKPFSLCC